MGRGVPHLCVCGKIVQPGDTCPCQIEAKRQRDRRHDARRPNSTQRGYNAEWRKKSREWLNHHPDCAFCGRPANLVDHIEPHKGDPKLFWDWRNWQSLCQPCHDRDKQRIERQHTAHARG